MFKINLKGQRFYKKIMGKNSEKTNDMLKKIYESNLKPNKETIIGKPIQIDNKIIYPVMEIVTMGKEIQWYIGAEISPIAILVEESGDKYVFSLTNKEIYPEKIIEMVP
ncbi:GerW family sporulation protein [Methanobacterium oryzae]|uniref:GerW family sporulation protein n=1 Tax=Methanobacterium oryzae TaxID=69540 RepID=UPI003D1D90E9